MAAKPSPCIRASATATVHTVSSVKVTPFPNSGKFLVLIGAAS
jgi:hypothetical protein